MSKKLENLNIKKWHVILLCIIVFSAITLAIYQRVHWPTVNVTIKGQQLELMYAKSRYHMNRGLGGRESTEPFDGMLFVFDASGRQGIVMRDMRFPIDIVWVDKGVVVDIAPNVPIQMVPENQLIPYYPRKSANMVIELPAGWAREHGLVIGDKLQVF